jgi:hypothetical protein
MFRHRIANGRLKVLPLNAKRARHIACLEKLDVGLRQAKFGFDLVEAVVLVDVSMAVCQVLVTQPILKDFHNDRVLLGFERLWRVIV